MCPEQHCISGSHGRARTHNHPRPEGSKRVLPVALLHNTLVESTSVDDHIRMELLEHHQLELRIPLLLVVGEGVGLKDDVAEVRGHQQGVTAIMHSPELVEIVTEHTCRHTLLLAGWYRVGNRKNRKSLLGIGE